MILTMHLTSVRQVHSNTKRGKKQKPKNKQTKINEEVFRLKKGRLCLRFFFFFFFSDLRYFLTQNEEGKKK